MPHKDIRKSKVIRIGSKHCDNSDEGMTALHVAASRGGKEAVKLLLDYGANVNAMDYNGDTPLDRVHQQDRKEIAPILKAAGGKRGHELRP